MDGGLEERRQRAFTLYERGEYAASYSLCEEVGRAGPRDPALSVLEASNLYALGRLEESEAHFRDLARQMPESSQVHCFLGKVLSAKGDEGARAEFAAAVTLDPGNSDALRWYATFLMAREEFSAAVPVLSRLAMTSRLNEDYSVLVRALIASGRGEEAVAVLTRNVPGGTLGCDYIDALMACGRFGEAAAVAYAAWLSSRDHAVLARYLRALVLADPLAALPAWEASLQEIGGDATLLAEYFRLLLTTGGINKAYNAVQLLDRDIHDPAVILEMCTITAAAGQKEKTAARFEDLIRGLLGQDPAGGVLEEAFSRYSNFLLTHYPAATAVELLGRVVGTEVAPVPLLAMAKIFEKVGDQTEARAWYYRAYRSDFLSGGLAYAEALARGGDVREAEKVLLYTVSHVRRSSDLIRVAATVTGNITLLRMQRLCQSLIWRLSDQREVLGSEGRELLALLLINLARSVLAEGDVMSAKRALLMGLDIVPPGSFRVAPRDFLPLLEACKAQVLADLAVIPAIDQSPGRQEEDKEEIFSGLVESLGLDTRESALLAFLRTHRRASEMDMRTLLKTRRAGGYLNRLVRKASEKGLTLIEKRGIGEDGEVYEYIGP
jgi:tetratricopeptide (TPR) repeat protein